VISNGTKVFFEKKEKVIMDFLVERIRGILMYYTQRGI